MKTTILTLSLLMCLGSMVYSYPGRYEIARQQQGTDVEYEMKVLAQILENKMQAVSVYMSVHIICMQVIVYNLYTSYIV